MDNDLRARLGSLGPIRDGGRDPSFSDKVEPVLLLRVGDFARRVDAGQRLRASGLGLKAAYVAITELADQDWSVCDVPIDGGIEALARDLLPLDVKLLRRRTRGAG